MVGSVMVGLRNQWLQMDGNGDGGVGGCGGGAEE